MSHGETVDETQSELEQLKLFEGEVMNILFAMKSHYAVKRKNLN